MEKTYILISCNVGQEHELHSLLHQIPEVKSCIITYGDYDLVVETEHTSSSEIDLLISKIRKIDKIRSTITLRVTN